MKIAVCEAPPVMNPDDAGWRRLAGETKRLRPDLFLLNEMPFGGWIATTPEPNRERLTESHRLHEQGLSRFGDLDVRNVLSTRALFEDERSVNQGFVWNERGELTPAHTKQFFPDEAGFYEARWYQRGVQKFELADVEGLRVGFLICTDVMFLEWARHYGRNAAHLIVVPRATPLASLERWKNVIATAAILSGCYVASSNRNGMGETGIEFGGRGWIFDPTGTLIAETSSDGPVASVEIDPTAATRAQTEYPCYVEELDRRTG